MSSITLLVLLSLLVKWSQPRGPCDPLVPEYCQLPFPNSFFTQPDAETLTGIRVNFSASTYPKDIFDRSLHLGEWNAMDGFTPFPSIIAYFPNLSDSNLPHHWEMAFSLDQACPTVLMDVSTGELLPHFAELDTAGGLPLRALMLWPSRRLENSHHYAVALRYLTNTTGHPVLPSVAFRALRDNITTNNPDIEYRRELFETLFSKLEKAGIHRESLQLVWDFTTASQDCITKRLLFMREDVFQRIGPKGPRYQITSVDDNYSQHIFRRLQGFMILPSYLTSPLPGSHLVLDNSGMPVYQGEVAATFTVLVPHSVANGSVYPALAVQYGHGLFSDQSEVESSYLQVQADTYGYVLFACNWWGMDKDDEARVILMMAGNLSNFRIIPDRLHQGMANSLSLMRLMKESLSTDPLLTFGGRQVIDVEHLHYYGNSLGGILGDVYMATTTDVIRGVLGVPGGPFSLLLPRSLDFVGFEALVRLLYPDPVDYVSGIALIEMLWSRLEPNGYMSYLTENPLPNTPTHRVIYYYALGDAQVNILGLYAIARSAGAIMYESNVRCQFSLPDGGLVREELFGFPLVPDDTVVTQDVVAVGFDFGAPPEPSGNVPPDSKTDTHEDPRRSLLAQKQMDIFLRSGEIQNVCNGPCNQTL